MEAPKCRICLKPHWLSVNCEGEPHQQQQNIQREGRRVLKGSTGKPAKPTRTASAERTDPPQPAKAPADRAIAEKAGHGAPKPRIVNVKKTGAVGDGKTDDTAAIQAAINIANAFEAKTKSRKPSKKKKPKKKSKPPQESTR